MLPEIPFRVTGLLPDRSSRPVWSLLASNNSKAVFARISNECLLANFALFQRQVWDKLLRRHTICFSLWHWFVLWLLLPQWFTATWNPLSFSYQHCGRDRARYQKCPHFHYILVCRDKILYSIFSLSSTNLPFSAVVLLDVLLKSIGTDARRECRISIYVRYFVKRSRGALLGIYETWDAAIH